MKIRLWGTEDECHLAAERLMATPGLVVLSVSDPYADRGASVLVRVFIEARLDPPPGPERVTCSAKPTDRPRPDQQASASAQSMSGGRRRREAAVGLLDRQRREREILAVPLTRRERVCRAFTGAAAEAW